MADSTLVPSWLNISLIEKALREGLNCRNLKIIKYETRKATAFGDHFGSRIFRYELTIQRNLDAKEENFVAIVKIMPIGNLPEEVESFGWFETEGKAYAEVLAFASSYLKEAYPGEEKLHPELYYHQGLPNRMLVMEDLRPGGFILADRYVGLDIEHTKLVVRSLAKLHAASVLIRVNKTVDLKQFNHSWNNNLCLKVFKKPFTAFLRNFRKWPNFDRKEIYQEKLERIEESFMEKMAKAWRKDDSKMNVLLHGDAWINNMMFRYGTYGKLTGMKFVDFQLMTLNSPVLDLQNVIFSSVRPDLRFNYQDIFLRDYHEVFEETLKRLGFDEKEFFTLENLQAEWKERLFWGFAVFYSVSPMIGTRLEKVFDAKEYFKEDSNFESIYENEDLRKTMREGFKFFEEKGVL